MKRNSFFFIQTIVLGSIALAIAVIVLTIDLTEGGQNLTLPIGILIVAALILSLGIYQYHSRRRE